MLVYVWNKKWFITNKTNAKYNLYVGNTLGKHNVILSEAKQNKIISCD